MLSDAVIVGPLMELVKTLLFLVLGVCRSVTVVKYIFSTVSIPPRPKIMGPYTLEDHSPRVGTPRATHPTDVVVS